MEDHSNGKGILSIISETKLMIIDTINIGVALQRNNYPREAKIFYGKAALALVERSSQDPAESLETFLHWSPQLQTSGPRSIPETDRRLLEWATHIMDDDDSCSDCTGQEAALEVFSPVFIHYEQNDQDRDGSPEPTTSSDSEKSCLYSMETCHMALLYNFATLAASLNWMDYVDHFAQEMKSLFENRIEPYADLNSCEDALRLCMVTKFYAAFFRLQQNGNATDDKSTQMFMESIQHMEDSVLLGCGTLRGSVLTASLYVTLAQVLYQARLLEDCNRVLLEATRALENEPMCLKSRILYTIHSLVGSGAPAA